MKIVKKIYVKSKKKAIPLVNREISWLHFNNRVLQEAANPDVPLLERLRFLGIFSNNLDEFFRVRVAALRRYVDLKMRITGTKEKPEVILKNIAQMTSESQPVFEHIYQEILDGLRKENIFVLNEQELNDDQREYVNNFYDQQLVDAITPIILNRNEDFPELRDARLYLSIILENNRSKSDKKYALIEIPTFEFSRFVVLPETDEGKFIILLEDVIRLCLPKIFKSLNYDHIEAYIIKITRDAEMDVDSELGESIVEKVSKGVVNRRYGAPLRFVYESQMPKSMRTYLLKQLEFKRTDAIIPGSRYHNFKDFISFPSIDRTDLEYKPAPRLLNERISKAHSVIEAIQDGDIFLHYPFYSFSQYVQLLREAAIDPKVKSIKITLYRMASKSKVAQALINAAKNGKHVTAVIELMARFDEEHNIQWAARMKDAGVNVIFGVEGYKIHSKLTLIKLKNGKGVTAISTGNFHERNAAVYTDFTLFTANNSIVNEVDKVFDIIEQPLQTKNFTHLLVSPHDMRKKLNRLIQTEINNAKKKLPAYIKCKINHVTDIGIIEKLYEAAKAGVKIQLIIRGMNSLFPNDESLKGNMEVISIVDKYLEHSRIFIFCNNEQEKFYISSADWMPRNLESRIEVAVPVYDYDIQQELKKIFGYAWKDNVKARVVDGLGANNIRTNSEKPFRSQFELFDSYTQPD